MQIKHEHIETILLAWAGEVGQSYVANTIAREYQRLGGGGLALVPGRTWANQQNIFHRWLKGETAQQREKIQQLIPAILNALPRDIRNQMRIYDTIERRALLAARSALETAIDAHDDAIELLYLRAHDVEPLAPKYH